MPNALPDNIEFSGPTMATYIFAMGDARAYTRALFPAEIEDAVTGQMRALTVADILALGAALDAFTESKLISVTTSLFYDDSDIPVSDAVLEDTFSILFTGGKTGFQVRVPNSNGISKAEARVSIMPYVRDPETGKIPKNVVNAVPKPDRRARMSC